MVMLVVHCELLAVTAPTATLDVVFAMATGAETELRIVGGAVVLLRVMVMFVVHCELLAVTAATRTLDVVFAKEGAAEAELKSMDEPVGWLRVIVMDCVHWELLAFTGETATLERGAVPVGNPLRREAEAVPFLRGAVTGSTTVVFTIFTAGIS